jgi:hypothetical protein
VHEIRAVLRFTFSSFATSDKLLEDQLDEAVGKATVVDTMNPARSLLIGAGAVVDGVASATNAIAAPWGPLLDKVKWFTAIVDKASEV